MSSMNMVVSLLVSALAVVISAYVLPGVHVTSFFVAIVAAVILSLANLVVKPLLVLLTLPVTILTFGLFLFVINALIILLVAQIVPGFSVDGFWWALAFSLVLSIVSSLLNSFA